MRTGTPRRAVGALVVALPLLLFAACEKDDAVVDVSGDHPILNIPMFAGDPAVLPRGTASVGIGIGGFDGSVPDGFARATGALGRYGEQETPPGPGSGFDMRDALRNSSTDRRAPALAASNAAVNGFFGMFNPAWCCGIPGAWDLYGQISGLKPNTDYTVALVRYGLTTRGELDGQRVLLGRAPDAADSLFLLGGAVAGTPDTRCNYNIGNPSSVGLGDNPAVVGFATSNANGVIEVDCIIQATTVPWWRNITTQSPTGVADSVPFGVNGLEPLDPGAYNYVILVEGRGTAANPLPAGAAAVRFQVGPDVDASGNAINNALAPFPTAVTDPNTVTGLPGGANAFATPVSLTLQFLNLPALAGGAAYQAFMIRNGSAAAAAGEHTVDETTTVQASFNSPGVAASHTLVINDVTAGAAPGEFDRVAVSLEQSGGAAAPSNAFLFFDYQSGSSITSSGTMLLGREVSGGTVERFSVTGTGKGQIFHDSLVVSLRRIATPPAGWEYAGFMVEVTRDGLQRQQSVGTVTLDSDGNTDVRIAAAQIGGLASYNQFILALQLGVGASGELSPFHIQSTEDYRAKFSDFFRQ